MTFGASVTIQWTTGITTAKELASAMAFGKMLYRDPTFINGNNSMGIYNNTSSGMVTHTRLADATAPNDSGYVIQIKTTGTASPNNGGFYFGTMCSNRKVFIARIIAKIPVGHNLLFGSNSIGTGGSSRWLTANAGTGDWCEYIYKVVCGTADFSTTHYYYLDGTQGTSAAPVVWQVAYATVFDLTSAEKYTTTIDANGVYTGTVKANQVIIDSALVVGGSSYNGSISVRDASNSVKVTLDRTGITATAGKIGGWTLGTSSLTASAPSSGHRIVMTSSGYIYHDNPNTAVDYWGLKSDGSATFGTGKISFAAGGSGFVAGGNFSWDADGNITAQKGTFKDVEVIGTVRNPFILNDSSIYIGGEDPQMNFNKYDHVVAIRGSWDEDIPLPWTLDHSGRRVCLVNYKWGSNTTVGTMSITAPSGKYFYEDGISKSSISFSRELVELLGYGDNTKAALITRGIAEMTRLGAAMGGYQETFSGLAGMGDLIVTCASKHSRNRKAGYLIGKGYSMQEAMDEVKMVVEGVHSAKAALLLAEKYYVRLPIIEQVNAVLFEGKLATEAVRDLMIRNGKTENPLLPWEK